MRMLKQDLAVTHQEENCPRHYQRCNDEKEWQYEFFMLPDHKASDNAILDSQQPAAHCEKDGKGLVDPIIFASVLVLGREICSDGSK